MKTLISGITGMVGSHMADYLLATQPDIEIIGLVRYRSPSDNIRNILDKITLEYGDLKDFSSLLTILEKHKPDYIFHFAAMSYVTTSYIYPAETLEKLNRANLGLNKDIDSIKTVVVSAVDADPLTAVSQQFLKEEKDLIIKGIELVKYLTSAEKIILAIPRDLAAVTADFKSDFSDVFAVDPVYPNGLPEILMRDISASADLGKSVFIKVEKLVASVTALYEGKPFVHKVVTVVDKNRAENFRVRIGTPIKELLKDNSIEDNFKVIIGGPMRGYTCLNTDLPVTDDMDCIYVQDRDEVVHNSNRQCINCGKCVRVCPVNIDVNLISRFSEFSIFEKCEELEVMNCIECGLCAYYCPAERSLVQYIRLAKKEIKNMEKMEGEEVQ